MKRIILPAIATFATILSTGAANAQTLLGQDFSKNNYLGGNLGATFSTDTHIRSGGPGAKGDVGGGHDIFGSVVIGHDMANGFAVEGETLYAKSGVGLRGSNGLIPTLGDRSVATYGGVVNLKYAPDVNWRLGRFPIAPYAAAGVGYGGSTYTLGGQSQSDDGLLWQAKTGVDVRVSPRLTLDVGYRYLTGPQFEPAHDGSAFDAVNLSSHQHIASVGLRWRY